jgi:hypothetical protein
VDVGREANVNLKNNLMLPVDKDGRNTIEV